MRFLRRTAHTVSKKEIFGGGLLLSKKAAAEKAAADEAAADEVIVFELSDREREIINGLG